MQYTITDRAADKLRDLLRRHESGAGGAARGGGSRSLVFVQCLSATAVGGNSILSQCYPAQVLAPACDYALPPEVSEGGGVLLTLLTTSGASAAPTLNGVYLCVVSGDVESDGSGSLAGRPRCFGIASAAASAWKVPARAATTTNGTLSTAFANGQVIDGVTLATGDRILIKDQTSALANGLYTVNASGAPTRATDADSGAELLGAAVVVTEGTANADTVWLCTANAPIVVGTTALPWVKVGPGGVGDVVGPASATDNAIARFDGATGKVIQNSTITINDSGHLVFGTGFVIRPDVIAPYYLIFEHATGASAPLGSLILGELLAESVHGAVVFATTAFSAGAVPGVSGTLGAGAVSSLGIITSLGSGTVGTGTVTGGSGGTTGLTLTGATTLTLGGTLAVANGGTGGADQTSAQTSLGVLVGTDVQAWDADLDALAALSGTNDIYYRSAANTWTAVVIGAGLTFAAGTLDSVSGGGDALTANPLSQFAATTSSQLAGVISDETGSGALVFATSPTLTTPALGTPSAVVLTNATGTAAGLTAGTATALATPRAINGTNFDGSAAITVTAAAGTLTGATLAAGVTASSLTSFGASIALGTPASGVLTNCTGLPTAGLLADSVTNANLANVATATFKARTTAGTGDPEDLTTTQATALLNVFVGANVAGTKGLVPSPGATSHANQPYILNDNGGWEKHSGKYLAKSKVTTSQTTTSTTAQVDLATADSITFTLDVSTDVLLEWSAEAFGSTTMYIFERWLITGTSAPTPVMNRDTYMPGNGNPVCVHVQDILTFPAGVYTVKMQHAVNTGTGTWRYRLLTAQIYG